MYFLSPPLGMERLDSVFITLAVLILFTDETNYIVVIVSFPVHFQFLQLGTAIFLLPFFLHLSGIIFLHTQPAISSKLYSNFPQGETSHMFVLFTYFCFCRLCSWCPFKESLPRPMSMDFLFCFLLEVLQF